MVDIVSPQAVAQTAHVFEVLAEIGAAQTPQVMVLNKIDRLPPGEARIETLRRRLLGDAEHKGETRAVGVSALYRRGNRRAVAPDRRSAAVRSGSSGEVPAGRGRRRESSICCMSCGRVVDDASTRTTTA